MTIKTHNIIYFKAHFMDILALAFQNSSNPASTLEFCKLLEHSSAYEQRLNVRQTIEEKIRDYLTAYTNSSEHLFMYKNITVGLPLCHEGNKIIY